MASTHDTNKQDTNKQHMDGSVQRLAFGQHKAHIDKRVPKLGDDAAPVVDRVIAVEVQALVCIGSSWHIHCQQLVGVPALCTSSCSAPLGSVLCILCHVANYDKDQKCCRSG